MAYTQINGSVRGTALEQMLGASVIVPGDPPSYQLCKNLYAYHPLGAKMVEAPISMAQSQRREIAVPNGPEERVKEAFEEEWKRIGADKRIFDVMRQARIYGIASIVMLVDGLETDQPVDYATLHKADISFNVLDPLITSGSLVLNQNPNAPDYLKTSGSVRVSGKTYHRSRTVVMMNEEPLFIEWTTSAFGYVGRSVYQRALFPMKSFVQSMLCDDMVAVKAGVLVAKLEQPGSIVDNVMGKLFGIKRSVVQEAQTYNVISVSTKEEIESLNLQNLDGAFGAARKNIIENIATATPMPSKLLLEESFAEGFGEGTEDAKYVARYVDEFRVSMAPLYEFFDRIVQHRAWNPEFYKTIRRDFPQYENVTYEAAFYDWVNLFKAEWPSLLTEPPSEKIKVDDVKLKAVIAMVQVLLPVLDPDNRAILIEWATDCFNALKLLFDSPLNLEFDALRQYQPPQQIEEPRAPRPFAAQDSVDRAVAALDRAMGRMAKDRGERMPKRLAERLTA